MSTKSLVLYKGPVSDKPILPNATTLKSTETENHKKPKETAKMIMKQRKLIMTKGH